MDYNGKPVGVEVKARKVDPTDLREAIDAKSTLELSNVIIISSKEYQSETLEFAQKHGIDLVTIDDILRKVQTASKPTEIQENKLTKILERDISDWRKHFVEGQHELPQDCSRSFRQCMKLACLPKQMMKKRKTLKRLGPC
jgi:3-hydroxyisobutyrate dehydrogenase-like beta-hydroxyacid dehydrogenase